LEAKIASAEGVDQEPIDHLAHAERLAVPEIWKVMCIRGGELAAIGRAEGPEAPGALLRIEDKNYEVLLSEGTTDAGWIYVTSLAGGQLPAR
jgi:hypothetical protein